MSHDPRPIKEALVKNHVKNLLKRYGVYFFMPVQTGYGAKTLDFICSHQSRFFAVETKAPGKHLTPKQQLIREEIEEAGGKVFVVGGRYEQGDHHLEPPNHRPVLKKRFSGMEALEGWLLLGQ